MIQSVLINKNINTLPFSINYLKKNNLIIDMSTKTLLQKIIIDLDKILT